MLTRTRIDELFTLRARAKEEDAQVIEDFRARYGFDPLDKEERDLNGGRWAIDRWQELRDTKSAILAYEEADRTMEPGERKELVEFAGWDGDLESMLCVIETRWLFATH